LFPIKDLRNVQWTAHVTPNRLVVSLSVIDAGQRMGRAFQAALSSEKYITHAVIDVNPLGICHAMIRR